MLTSVRVVTCLFFCFRIMNILVYSGDGAECVDVLCNSLNDVLLKLRVIGQYNVLTVTSVELYQTNWLDTTKLLVLPGGRDLPYVKELTGVALENIKKFIRDGGSYLGLCAGAYFSCSYVCFEKGTALEVSGGRELSLFEGTGKGCVYPGFKYSSTSGSKVIPLNCCGDLATTLGSTCFCYYNGGCEFIHDNSFDEYETLATYADYPEKKAIISLQLQQGKVVLAGVHPEMNARYLNTCEYSQSRWEEMLEHVAEQEKLFQWIIHHLLISV